MSKTQKVPKYRGLRHNAYLGQRQDVPAPRTKACQPQETLIGDDEIRGCKFYASFTTVTEV